MVIEKDFIQAEQTMYMHGQKYANGAENVKMVVYAVYTTIRFTIGQ